MTTTYDSGDYLGGMAGGDYTYKYKVCIPNSVPENCADLDVEQTLVDPCNPPTSVDLPALENQTYVLTDTSFPYTHAAPVVDPDYCEVSTSYNIPAFIDGSTAVSEPVNDDKTFNIFYDDNLNPLDEGPTTVTVTVTGSSKYDYGADNVSGTDSEPFDVDYENPCIDPAYVNIVPKTMED